jgi:SnoaL-like domain
MQTEMTQQPSSERLARLLDHQEIQDCLLRYCRGIDRHDTDLAKSAYHADARDDHAARIGPGRGLPDWANGVHDETFAGHQHYITNTMIEIDGDTAHVETYFILAALKKGTGEHSLGGGRYIDRFERRDDVWAIADRIVTHEWWNDSETLKMVSALSVPAAADGADPAYRRPLRADRDDRVLFGPGGTEPVPIS